MRIIRTDAYYSGSNGSVWIDRDFVVDFSDEYMVCFRVKIIDLDSDYYGWNWIFVGVVGGDVSIYINGKEYDVSRLVFEVSGDDSGYILDNVYVSQICAWKKILSEKEMNIVMNDGVVAADDLLLWLIFHREKAMVFTKENVDVYGGVFELGDTVDGNFSCVLMKVIGSG